MELFIDAYDWVMVAQCDRMGSRLNEHLRVAEPFLAQLHGDS
jgi:deoxyribodipyrimidine photolyase-like uncharacterized protein